MNRSHQRNTRSWRRTHYSRSRSLRASLRDKRKGSWFCRLSPRHSRGSKMPSRKRLGSKIWSKSFRVMRLRSIGSKLLLSRLKQVMGSWPRFNIINSYLLLFSLLRRLKLSWLLKKWHWENNAKLKALSKFPLVLMALARNKRKYSHCTQRINSVITYSDWF